MASVVGIDEKMITCKPAPRVHWFGDSNAAGIFSEAVNIYQPEVDSVRKQLKTGLTEDDERRLEKALHLAVGTLNKYNKDYWGTCFIKIPKKGRVFELTNPQDELEYRILSQHSKFATGGLGIQDNPEAEFYFTSDEQDAQVKNTKIKIERDAVKRFGALDFSDMVDVLKYFALMEGKKTGTINKTSSRDFVEATLYDRVKNSPKEFLAALDNKAFKTIVFIEKCVEHNIISKSGARYSIKGGETLGVTLEATIDYLEDPHNQDVYFLLKDKLDAIDK